MTWKTSSSASPQQIAGGGLLRSFCLRLSSDEELNRLLLTVVERLGKRGFLPFTNQGASLCSDVRGAAVAGQETGWRIPRVHGRVSEREGGRGQESDRFIHNGELHGRIYTSVLQPCLFASWRLLDEVVDIRALGNAAYIRRFAGHSLREKTPHTSRLARQNSSLVLPVGSVTLEETKIGDCIFHLARRPPKAPR